MSFESIFKTIQKGSKNDPHSTVKLSSDPTLRSSVPYGVPSGIPRLDISIGRPGLPAGRIVEFFGFEMCGKTTAALHALYQAQRKGGGGMFIDAECSWDEERAMDIGIDPDRNLIISDVDTIEATFRQIDFALDGLIESEFNKPFVIVVDSVTAVTSEDEKNKDIGATARVGEDARVIRQNMRKIMSKIAESKACVIFINHAVSTIAATPYAKQSKSSGGHAIKFFATLRCEFKNAGQLKDENDKSVRKGQKINISIEKLKKSRLERPEIKEVLLMNENGFDLTEELLQGAILSGFVGHPKGSRTYSIESLGREFPKADWPSIVDELGGPDIAYDTLIEWSLKNNVLNSWGGVEYE